MSKQITEQQLINGLVDRSAKGCFAITITARTDCRAKKTGNPYGPIFKVSRVNGMANWQYSNSVNNQRGREGLTKDFEAAERQWGARIDRTPLVIHAGKMYLELKVERSLSCEYFTASGTPLAFEEVAPFLPGKQTDSGRQGTEKAVILRDYAIANILSVATDGETYEIVHPEPIAPLRVA